MCNRFQIAEGDGEGVSVYLDEPEFLRSWHFDKGRLRSSLEILSLSNYLTFEPYPNSQPYLRYDQPRWTMDRFLNDASPAAKVAVEILRNYEGLFCCPGVFVSVDMLARKTGLEAREVAKSLRVSAECRFLLCSSPQRTPDHF